MKITLKHLTKVFENKKAKTKVVAVNDLDVEIPSGKLIGLLGPSGCGKSTTLFMLSGLEQPTSGNIIFGDDDVTTLAPEKRGIGLVFQNYALYPHMTVEQNIMFPLENMRVPKDEAKQRAFDAAKLVQIEGLLNRKPSELSGGQQQRVAIARALVNEPKVLLLDESLGSLDLKLRQEMEYELKKIQRNLGITFIFVTHDQEEALTMSDKVVVMNNGEIQQVGTPIDVYNEPANRFVANFIGKSNIIDGIMIKDLLCSFDGKEFECVDKGFKDNENVDIVIRPEDIDIVKKDEGFFNGIVISEIFKGVHYEIHVQTENRDFLIHTTDYHGVNEEVGLIFTPDDIHIMEW